jgi:TolA-binding protein
MTRPDPPSPDLPSDARRAVDADALLRAFVEAPVLPLPSAEASALRERITRQLEPPRSQGRVRGLAGRWRPWAVFAAAACLPILIWGSFALVHPAAARRADTAMVRSLVGPSEIARGLLEQPVADTGDSPLGPGDELRTGRDAWARASLPTGAVVDVGPSVRLRFSAIDPSTHQGTDPGVGHGTGLRDRLELTAGRIQVQVPKLAAGSELRVQTPDATVVVHGTKFSVDRVEAAGSQPASTRVSVTEGVVTVDTDRGQRTLTAGMELVTPETPAAAATSSSPSAPARDDAPSAAPGTSSPGTLSTLASENALLSEAMKVRRDGQIDRALALVDAFVARYPRSPLMETARVERLGLLEQAGSMARLGREAARYLADYPRGYARPEATRMLARAQASSP